ncbi:LacI family DNA-binding transcriptional regulator [Niabella yanshanensis]|uniref:LacI family DNA-binding transcriptional regulator n=1 Tax=Niabella yanshanensis TaxID=577386 RepID=A0ABZ0W8Y0_9BACT|nr:LacI family DNA-binding transcriptional regulator [Niabella yanshanensis]WQD38516.1 LacI family DNA-binding transcriptional regulator [Niabella yanshanensis]
MKGSSITIVDIAKKLNISKSTVSRALTNNPNVNPETRQKVLALADQLAYQPNMLSIGLRTNKTKTIGIVVPELISSFYPTVMAGAQEAAAQRGFSVLTASCNENYATEVANSKVMLANCVDGVLVSITKETINYDHWMTFYRRGIPIVFFDRVCGEMMVPKVVVSDYESSFNAVAHLVASGRKRIAHLTGPAQMLIMQKRLNGYRAALNKHGLTYDESLVIDTDLNVTNVKMQVKYLLEQKQPVDAIFAVNDAIAMEAVQVLKKMNKRVPEDIAVVGFGDHYGSGFADPALTTIAVPNREMGKTAMSLLLSLMDKEPASWKPITRILDGELVVRQSTIKPEPMVSYVSSYPGVFQMNSLHNREFSDDKKLKAI